MDTKGFVIFTGRSHRPRRVVWLRWLGAIILVITVLETFYLAQHSVKAPLHELRIFRYKASVLRPGQYRETSAQQYVLGAPDNDIVEEVDDMGMNHDRR
jgi:hypothetical protein